MSRCVKATTLMLVAALVSAGCARVPVEREFRTFQSNVHERTGRSIEWMDVSADEQHVIAEVGKMLQGKLSSEEAVHVALLNNQRLQATYGEFGIALADLVQAGLPPNPVAEVIVRFQEDSEFNLRVWEIIVVQDFLDILLIPLHKKLAAAEFEQAKLRVTSEVVGLATDTRIAYYRLQSAQQMLELAHSVLLSYEASLEMALRLYRAGNVPEVMVLTERSGYEQAKLATAAAEMMVAERREGLNKLMGLWGNDTGWTIEERLPPLPEEEVNLDNLEQRAVDASLDLAMAWSEIETVARRHGIKTIETVIPELTIGGEFERETEIETEIGENSAGEPELSSSEGPDLWWRGPSVAFPIPIFDQGQPARTRKQIAVRQAWDQFTALAIEIRAATRLARYRLQYTRDVANYYDQIILPVQQRLRIQTQLRYNAMFLGVFQLLEVKREEVNAGRQYIESLRDYWVARARLDQLLMGQMPMEGGSSVEGMGSGQLGMAAGSRARGGH